MRLDFPLCSAPAKHCKKVSNYGKKNPLNVVFQKQEFLCVVLEENIWKYSANKELIFYEHKRNYLLQFFC